MTMCTYEMCLVGLVRKEAMLVCASELGDGHICVVVMYGC